MAYERRDNSGSLFKNTQKKTDKHPDYRGDGIINGQDVWINAWLKSGKKGTFMSLAFSPKDERGEKQQRDSKPVANDEDIPF